jgi:hypothetical protein
VEWLRLGTVAGVGGVRFVDEIGFAFGWIAPERGFMQRASHAVAAQGRVWVLDPLADLRALGRAPELCEPAGVVQLLDRHGRGCRAVAEQLGVPYYQLGRGCRPAFLIALPEHSLESSVGTHLGLTLSQSKTTTPDLRGF